ncbi:MAG TPA: TOBE domain-containing protein, partial [Gaiellaceae bacterium]|nr:TOBE domain-containing protein [Gaiellaceae bacterium]
EPPMNLFEGQLVEDRGPAAREATLAVAGEGWRTPLSPRIAARLRGAERDVVVGARPEHMRLGTIDGPATDRALAGRVFFREPRGDVDVVLVRLDRPPGRDLVTVELPAGTEWKENDAVEIRLPATELHVFDAQSGRNLLAAHAA